HGRDRGLPARVAGLRRRRLTGATGGGALRPGRGGRDDGAGRTAGPAALHPLAPAGTGAELAHRSRAAGADAGPAAGRPDHHVQQLAFHLPDQPADRPARHLAGMATHPDVATAGEAAGLDRLRAVGAWVGAGDLRVLDVWSTPGADVDGARGLGRRYWPGRALRGPFAAASASVDRSRAAAAGDLPPRHARRIAVPDRGGRHSVPVAADAAT